MNDDIEKIIKEYFKAIQPEVEYANGDDGFFSCRARSADWFRQALHQAQQSERERILALRPEEQSHEACGVTGICLAGEFNRALQEWTKVIRDRNTTS